MPARQTVEKFLRKMGMGIGMGNVEEEMPVRAAEEDGGRAGLRVVRLPT